MADKTVTVGPGKDYETLAAALTGESADLTSGTYYNGGPGRLFIDCYNLGTSTEDTAPADTGTSYVTSADYYIVIRGALSERLPGTTGVWSTSRYRLHVTDANGLTIQASYTRVQDIQLWVTISAANPGRHGFTVATQPISPRFERCISRCEVSTISPNANFAGFYFGAGAYSAAPVYVINCLAWNWKVTSYAAGFHFDKSSGTGYFFNNTAYNCTIGFRRTNGTAYWVNCGAAACTTAFSGGTQDSCSSTTPTFVDSGAGDFHLAENDTTWVGNGAGTTGPPSNYYSDDVDATARPSPWSIGFDDLGTGRNPVPMGFVVE